MPAIAIIWQSRCMAVGFNHVTDLYDIYNVVQNTIIRYPKEVIIFTLREVFEKDSYYHYVRNAWGFPETPDHTDLDPYAGMFDDGTTRIYIGEQNRGDQIYYPALIVKSGGARSKPLSLNRDQYVVGYKSVLFTDTDGHERLVQRPEKFILSGAWESSMNIEVLARGIHARDDLVEIVALLFKDWKWNELNRAGISVKPNISIGSPSESEDRNDKLYRQTVTLELWTEWRREIPVESILDAINFCVDLGHTEDDVFIPAPNISISTKVELLDAFQPA